MEQHLIEKYDCIIPKGYNKSKGGEYGALGMHHSVETRKKMSESHKGKLSPRKGVHLSAETRRKLSESHKGQIPWNRKAVICVETGISYSSCTEAAESIGVTSKAISNVLRGKSKTSGGYHWKYVET